MPIVKDGVNGVTLPKPVENKYEQQAEQEFRPQTKEECIKRQGTIQAAMQSPGIVAFAQNWEDYCQKVRELANDAIAFVEKR